MTLSLISQVYAQSSLSGPAPLVNIALEGARQVGVKQCLPAIARLSSLAMQGSTAQDMLLDWDRSKPDAAPLFALIGSSFAQGASATSITAVPDGNACTVMAERMTIAPEPCKAVMERELVGYQAQRLLPVFTVLTSSADPGGSVSLIDSQGGCLVIRRFMQYRWTEATANASGGAGARPAAPALTPARPGRAVP